MADFNTGLMPTSERSDSEPSTDIPAQYTVLKGQILLTNNNLHPPRTSSPSSPRSLLPSPRSFTDAAGNKYPFRTPASVEQTQMTRMLQRAKKKFAALFSPKQTPPTDEPENPECIDAADLCRREQAELIPVPGRHNRFWHRPSLQRTRDRAERKLLRGMSPHARDRRTVTAESTGKMSELEEERVAVRDFQPEHDQVKEEEIEKEENAKEEAAKEEEEKAQAGPLFEERV